jgi:hypothetical protein
MNFRVCSDQLAEADAEAGAEAGKVFGIYH